MQAQSKQNRKQKQIIDTLSAKLKRLEKLGDVSDRIALCRSAFSLIPTTDTDEIYVFGVKLASILIALPDPVPIENIEEAIKVLRRVERAVSNESPEKWAGTARNLGLVYQLRRKGSPRRNLAHAKTYYESALTVFTRTKTPMDWALTKAALGEVLANLKNDSQVENTRQAIKHLKGALLVYTKSKFPEEFKEYSSLLHLLKHRLHSLGKR